MGFGGEARRTWRNRNMKITLKGGIEIFPESIQECCTIIDRLGLMPNSWKPREAPPPLFRGKRACLTVEEMRQAKHRGFSYEEIAAKAGVTRQCIYYHIGHEFKKPKRNGPTDRRLAEIIAQEERLGLPSNYIEPSPLQRFCTNPII